MVTCVCTLPAIIVIRSLEHQLAPVFGHLNLCVVRECAHARVHACVRVCVCPSINTLVLDHDGHARCERLRRTSRTADRKAAPHRTRQKVAGPRSRKDNAPQNLALMRKLALNILRQHPDKGSIKGKIKRAGWDDAFLLSLLGHMR